MSKYLKSCYILTSTLVGALFTLVPETVFGCTKLFAKCSDEVNIILNRVIAAIAIFIISLLIQGIVNAARCSVTIKGKNYVIKVCYGDLFKMKKYKKIIPFDECFTTTIGTGSADINESSLCGQYLKLHPISDIGTLLSQGGLKAKRKSKYCGLSAYEPGRMILKEDFLLMAFAKLNKDGLGELTRSEYINCLEVMWEEIGRWHGGDSLCVPVLGSGVTNLAESQLSQQELLDIMIHSYMLVANKLKLPQKLYIVCRRKEGFSLNNI